MEGEGLEMRGIFCKRQNCIATLRQAPGGPTACLFVRVHPSYVFSPQVHQPCCPQGLLLLSSTYSSWDFLTLWLVKHVSNRTHWFWIRYCHLNPSLPDLMDFRHPLELPAWHNTFFTSLYKVNFACGHSAGNTHQRLPGQHGRSILWPRSQCYCLNNGLAIESSPQFGVNLTSSFTLCFNLV